MSSIDAHGRTNLPSPHTLTIVTPKILALSAHSRTLSGGLALRMLFYTCFSAVFVSPAAFLHFARDSAFTFTPAEHIALLAFADSLDPSLTVEGLISALSCFLLDHPSISARFNGPPHRGIAGQPVKITTTAFQTNIRNVVLSSQQPNQRDVGSSTQR